MSGIDIAEVQPGMRIRYPVGLCTVAQPLKPARRNGEKIGYRLRLQGPDGNLLSPVVVKYGTVIEVEPPE